MIKVENLTYTYHGKNEPTLNGLDFTVDTGEIFGFLGPSGAGKSTTQKILLGLLKQYGGSVRIGDCEISESDNSFYERIGAAFEFPHFYTKFTAAENLRFYLSLYKTAGRSVGEMLEAVGLADEADKKVGDYSKGMKMRLNLCRALIHNPDLIFLDEPTSGLDPVNAKNVRRLIREEKNRGKTVFLTTHNMHSAAELCDRIAFITGGRLAIIDSPRNLMLEHGRRSVTVECRKQDGRRTSRDFPLDGLRGNEDFQQMIGSTDLETIHTREATLDDVFVKITGEGLQ